MANSTAIAGSVSRNKVHVRHAIALAPGRECALEGLLAIRGLGASGEDVAQCTAVPSLLSCRSVKHETDYEHIFWSAVADHVQAGAQSGFSYSR
jgi:hypothetical protein